MSESDIDRLISLFAKLPGLGPRSARRAVLYLIKHKETVMQPLSRALIAAFDSIKICDRCGNLDTVSPCGLCVDIKRDNSQICIVEDVADLWAIERSHVFKGLYHVLGGTLSVMDGRGPEALGIEKLAKRIREGVVTEVILATNATVEGQTTAHYISERLKNTEVRVSQLAHGIPLGGELDYMDDGTLGAALAARKELVS